MNKHTCCLGENLKQHLKQKAMEFYGEEDCFRKEIKIANLQISTDLPSVEEVQLLEQNHNRKNIARFYSKKNVDSIPYENLFKEVESRVQEMPHKGDTSEAEKKFLERHSNLVVISGQPGIGKTTLTKCMLHKMWESELFQPDIVFFIQFRKIDYKEKTDLLQFLAPISQCLMEMEDRQSILKRIMKSDKVFIIMDGLDEARIDPKMKNFTSCNITSDGLYTAERYIQNLIAGEILPCSKKMITSRPHRITQLQNTEFKPKVLFTIQGLDAEARKQICSNICGDNGELCGKILGYLRARPDLESHCHTPVICIMVMRRLKSRYDTLERSRDSRVEFVVENTLTAIFVDALEKWLLEKLDASGDAKFPIKNIATFAFDKFIKGQLYFPSHELDEARVDNQYWSTFLNTFLNGNQEMYFNHLMWQEFLASVKLRLYTKKQEYGKENEQGNILTVLSNKKFEAVTTRFLFGLCNKHTLAALLRCVSLEEGRNDEEERKECENLLKQHAIEKLERYCFATYLSDNHDDDDCDDDSDDNTDVDFYKALEYFDPAISSRGDVINSSGSREGSNNGDSSDRDENSIVSFGSGDDVGEVVDYNEGASMGNYDDDYHDEIDDDLDARSYFGAILPTLGWVHEIGTDEFSQHAAACLRQKFCIENQILPSDIPIIMHILRARQSYMSLSVVYPRFLGNCSQYFFQELSKILKEKNNLQVSV